MRSSGKSTTPSRLLFAVSVSALTAACNGALGLPSGPRGAGAGEDGQGGVGVTSDSLPGANGKANEMWVDPTGCVGTRDYFEQVAFPHVFSHCLECHVPGGVSAGTRFVLFPDSVEGYLALNYDVVDRARALTAGGVQLLVAKPTGAVAHGGEQVILPGSQVEATLRRTLDEMAAPMLCPGDPGAPSASDVLRGLSLLSPEATLRKALLSLVGRVPSSAELQVARAQGLDGVDQVLIAAMGERSFHERLLEIWNDVFLTDQNLAANGGGVFDTFDQHMFPNLDYAGASWLAPGELVADSFAREPLELVAHVIMNDRPLTEILTAKYRMVNPMTAKALSLSVSFDDPNDAHEFREVQIPALHELAPGRSEYAGVLTTNGFLKVVTGASTNRNRRRARYLYKWFLDFDIMKTATRVDFSTVDFAANPWRNDPKCTGCHAKIDPVAGLFQNWTDCYDNPTYKYFKPGARYCGQSGLWYDASSMFAPGFGENEPIDSARLPQALEDLAEHVIGDPAFARAMVRHMFAGVVGRPSQDAPQNVADPSFAALQAAYEAERASIEELATWFSSHGFDTKQLILRIVRSPYFRAYAADRPGRAELVGIGSGGLVGPESMNRKLLSLLGQGWGDPGSAHGYEAPSRSPYYLRDFKRLRLHAGGTDSKNPGQRLERPSGLTSAVFTRMAYEMACRVVPLELSVPKASRALLPYVDTNLVPSGDASAPDQMPILQNLQLLHAFLLGEDVALDSSELLESYALLVDLRASSQGAPTDLGACRASTNFATGANVPGGLTQDASYMVRAWQGVIAYMLMDPKFLFE